MREGHTAAALAALFVLLFLLERVFPLRPRRRSLLARLAMNLAVSALAFAVAQTTVRPAALAAQQWAASHGVGVGYGLSLPLPAQAIVTFLLMDLTFYWWHLANHRIPLLWRFHNVHHIDPDLDVSTAFRFHAGEVAFSVLFRVAQVSVIGPPLALLIAYEALFQANTMFHHSNVRLPVRVERLLNLILVTPRMHGIHHSQRREETTANYSVVFSWWDRVHRTRRLERFEEPIDIGVPAYLLPADNTFTSVVTLPFRRQRRYWL
jgi:sterol desaturase/sphingolipid hydroxylase (fatty acid hydroxylase superfamily)